MIKGNKSDVTDIVFEILAKKDLKLFLFYIVSAISIDNKLIIITL